MLALLNCFLAEQSCVVEQPVTSRKVDHEVSNSVEAPCIVFTLNYNPHPASTTFADDLREVLHELCQFTDFNPPKPRIPIPQRIPIQPDLWRALRHARPTTSRSLTRAVSGVRMESTGIHIVWAGSFPAHVLLWYVVSKFEVWWFTNRTFTNH